MSCDDGYAPFVATTIASACDHTKKHLHFYVIDCGISTENKNKINLLKKYFSNFDIEWLDLDINHIFEGLVEREHFTKAMYGRLVFADLKPSLHKAIYTDVDVIFCGDIEELYNENLGNYIIGAVWEDYMESNRTNNNHLKRLGIPYNHQYFSSGLLLINLDAWRSQQCTKSIFQEAKRLRSKLLFPDQDLLNYHFANNYCQLSEKYVVTAPRARKHYQHGKLINCVIRHFEGPKKPWLCHPLIPEIKKSNYIGKSIFWKYAKMTAFYPELISRFPVYNRVMTILNRLRKYCSL